MIIVLQIAIKPCVPAALAAIKLMTAPPSLLPKCFFATVCVHGERLSTVKKSTLMVVVLITVESYLQPRIYIEVYEAANCCSQYFETDAAP
jgi:hypothetical protein